jgi:hypothetical protein
MTERDVTAVRAEFAVVWTELFPAEQARIVHLLIERVEFARSRSRCGSGSRGS